MVCSLLKVPKAWRNSSSEMTPSLFYAFYKSEYVIEEVKGFPQTCLIDEVVRFEVGH